MPQYEKYKKEFHSSNKGFCKSFYWSLNTKHYRVPVIVELRDIIVLINYYSVDLKWVDTLPCTLQVQHNNIVTLEKRNEEIIIFSFLFTLNLNVKY